MSSIDEYDLGQPLGRGAFATVYRARNRKSGKAVAIKVCERPPHDDHNWEMRMKNEISIHSQLRHPNVVALFNCFEDNTRVYLVLELCEGGNLYQCLRENGPLGEQLATPIIQQLTNALNCIQSHGVMHRDLKLSNILLTGDLHDPKTIVKLCDFGLACRKEHPDEEHFTFCGTPNYIAPEIVSNNSHDLPADLWSLGCLFYTMVVGFPPFERDEKEEIFMRIKTGIYEEPTDVMSENGLHLLRSLLELNPSKRASIKDLLVHPLLSPTTLVASSPYPKPRGSNHNRINKQIESSDEFSSHFVSVGRRSNPTQAGWDEVGSSNTVRMNRSDVQHTQQHWVHAEQTPAKTSVAISTTSRAVLLSEDDSYSVSDKPPSLQQPPAPHSLHKQPYAFQFSKDHHLSDMQPPGTRHVHDLAPTSEVSHELSLQQQERVLQQQLHAAQAELQRVRQVQRSADTDGSSATMSTALVTYPTNSNQTGRETNAFAPASRDHSAHPPPIVYASQVTSNSHVHAPFVTTRSAAESHYINQRATNQRCSTVPPRNSDPAPHVPPPAATQPPETTRHVSAQGCAAQSAAAQQAASFGVTSQQLLHRPTPSDTEPTQAYRASTPKKTSAPPSHTMHSGASQTRDGTSAQDAVPSALPASRSASHVVTPTKNQNMSPNSKSTVYAPNQRYAASAPTTGDANSTSNFAQNTVPTSPIGAISHNTTANLSTSFLHGLSYSFDLNNTSNRSDSFMRSSRSWLDSIGEIRSSVSGISNGESRSGYSAGSANAAAGAAVASRMHTVNEERRHSFQRVAVAGQPLMQGRVQNHTNGANTGNTNRESEWMRQYAYEKHINGARGLSVHNNNNHSPISISHNLSTTDSTAEAHSTPLAPSAEPTLHKCLDSVYRDMSSLKPFCFSSSKDELLLLSTEKELLLVLQVRKQVPNCAPEVQHFRLLLSLSNTNNIVLGQMNAEMVLEVEKIAVEVLTAGQKSAKNKVFDDLAPERSGSLPAQDALKFHHCYSAPKLQVFSNRSGTKTIDIGSSEANQQSVVPKLVTTMLLRVYLLLLSAKSRMPKQVTYFTTQMSALITKYGDNRPNDHGAVTENVQCKCMLMRNDPFPDFIVQWSDGARLRYELKTGRLQIVKPSGELAGQNTTKTLKWTGFISLQGAEGGESHNVSSVLPILAPYVSVAQRALAKCLTEWNKAGNSSGIPKVHVLD